MSGKLIIFSAPSGSGKTTIVRHLLSSDLDLEFSISATSREIRGNEVNGKDYYYFSVELFKEKIDNGEFIEWEEVYKDHFYGTLKSEINRIWDKGRHVIFDVDVVGGLNLKSIFGEKALSIFVMPPGIDDLKVRLEGRGPDSSQKIEMRVKKAQEEMERAREFDLIIINDDLDKACSEAVSATRLFLEKQ